MEFRVVSRDARLSGNHQNLTFLIIDRWNDFSFVTQFQMTVFDHRGERHDIGYVKIGFVGQTTEVTTHEKLEETFSELDSSFFSLGNSINFYKNIADLGDVGRELLEKLNDLACNPSLIESIREEEVFAVSLLRDTSLSVIKGQYHRVLNGGKELTNYQFSYVREGSESYSDIELEFDVTVESKPSTNIHAIIGRNGVGKTTLLNDMIKVVTRSPDSNGAFVDRSGARDREIDEEYFSSLISVSFSAFDPFTPPEDQPDPSKGTCYYYIGLKDVAKEGFHHDISALNEDCCRALRSCFNDDAKDKLWSNAIECLGYDENFSSANLMDLRGCFNETKQSLRDKQYDSAEFEERFLEVITPTLDSLSSGHSIVLLTITKLVATVQEKTLVLIDEPESHLHPPLLAAFIRALSDLLLTMNGVSIIATHSPVVLQEIPKNCVWKVYRQGVNTIVDRPKIETFAENLGTLTSEVFGLEVEQSGFHEMLKKSVESGKAYKEILQEYRNQIGYEGRAILKGMIADRDKESNND
ncbi:MAG: ATP-binding protein [Gammaproteobacteria bacterium]|nr:ATP-binding protein [Gammaproteobacteria bacterium]MBU1467318.1 ATP-binding protein [Gammaproteobacteria bacterium]MBU2021836.1 ATP-binding protein [Gammaproteobacteria bacterium]MBU2237377.1 ATP-binding protein [Gammaproteobacteria bacterium]MBU2320353.1 ATP-binding protein [Gammaproteobacteria bacterium]